MDFLLEAIEIAQKANEAQAVNLEEIHKALTKQVKSLQTENVNETQIGNIVEARYNKSKWIEHYPAKIESITNGCYNLKFQTGKGWMKGTQQTSPHDIQNFRRQGKKEHIDQKLLGIGTIISAPYLEEGFKFSEFPGLYRAKIVSIDNYRLTICYDKMPKNKEIVDVEEIEFYLEC